MKNIKLIILTILFALPVLLTAAPVIDNVAVVNGTCVSNASITVHVTNLEPAQVVTYGLREIDNNYPEVKSQFSNYFPGLPAGTYVVSVYDGPGNPIQKTVTVTSSYKSLVVKTPVVATSACSGSLQLGITSGTAPYTYTIKNLTTNEERLEWTATSTSMSHTFGNLPLGVYECYITDNCGVSQGIPTNLTTIASGALVSVPFTSLDLVNPTSYIYGNGECGKILVRLYSSYLSINGSTTIATNTENAKYIKYRVEYPLGTYSDCQISNSYGNHMFSNYNPMNPGKFRVEVLHPCSGEITRSQLYDMPTTAKTYSKYNYLQYDDFCNLPTKGMHYLQENSTGINGYTCNEDKTVTLTPALGGVPKEYAWSKTNSALTIYDLPVSTKYAVVIKIGNSVVDSYDFTTLTPTVAASANFSLQGGTNYGPTCNFETGTLYSHYTASNSYTVNTDHPIKYTLLEGPSGSISRESITRSTPYNNTLWNDLPFGTYKIKVEYFIKGNSTPCREQVYTYNLLKQVNAFAAKTPIVTSPMCGNYTLDIQGYFTNTNDVPYTNSNSYYRYSVLLTNLDTGASSTHSNFYSNYVTQIANLSPGKYKLQYYYYNNPLATRCYYLEQEVTLAEFVQPTLNLAQSGGITCGTEKGSLTVTATGDSQPFEYRFQAGDNVQAITGWSAWQSENVFKNLESGQYAVQIRNTCQRIVPYPIRIFNGSEQFVTLIGSADGSVCYGKTGIVSVLSIGPVESYQWYKDDILIVGATDDHYEIRNMDDADTGTYKVIISTGAGGCTLSSSIDVTVKPLIGATNDSITVLPFEKRVFDVFANDNIGACIPQACEQILEADKIQVEGYAAGVLEGSFGKIEIVDNKIQYTAPAQYADGIVRFTYRIECVYEGVTYMDNANVAIYILQSCTYPSVCAGDNFTVCFKEYPAGKVTFVVKEKSTGTAITLPLTYNNMTANKVLEVTPIVETKEFPTIDFTIYVIDNTNNNIRWKGTVDNSWHNPNNWVLINPDNTDGAAIGWTPTNCVDAEIPSKSPKYPKLDTEGSINNLYMKDRAMLGSNYKLTYRSVSVDLKLDVTEKDRWVMYSSPLRGLYSGDYMLRKSDAAIVEEGVYMRFYQSTSLDEGSTPEPKTTTRTFGNLEQKLVFGKPFFLRVDPSKDNAAYFSFPKTDAKYAYYKKNDWSTTYPAVVETAALDRNATVVGRFVIEGCTTATGYVYTMAPTDDMNASEVVMISNPFPAYLEVKKFLEANSSVLEQGYWIWEGVENSFMKYNAGHGNRWTIEDVDQIKNNIPADTEYIAPHQSFFVVKKAIGSTITVKFDPENMTTITPLGITGDYKLK